MGTGIDVQVEAVNGLIVSTDAVSGGTASLISYPVVIGQRYVINISVNIATFTIDFRGNRKVDCDAIGQIAKANSIELASGNLDPLNNTSAGATSFGNLTITPISFNPSVVVRVSGGAAQAGVYTGYSVTYLSDLVLATFG